MSNEKSHAEIIAEQIGLTYNTAVNQATNHTLKMVHTYISGQSGKEITLAEFKSFVDAFFPNNTDYLKEL